MAGIHRVNPALEPLLVPIAHLREDPDNANDHGDRSVNSIAQSYHAFGQQKPIIARRDGMVIAGNGQLRAARDILGWTEIAVVMFDDEDEAKQVAFALADNRSAQFATWNTEKLGEAFAKLENAPFDVEDAIGFTQAEQAALTAEWAVQPLDPNQVGEHNEDGKHGMVKVENVDLEVRDRVVGLIRDALEEAGFDYNVRGC